MRPVSTGPARTADRTATKALDVCDNVVAP